MTGWPKPVGSTTVEMLRLPRSVDIESLRITGPRGGEWRVVRDWADVPHLRRVKRKRGAA